MTKEEYDYLVSVKDTGTDIERVQDAVVLHLFPEWENSTKIKIADGMSMVEKIMEAKFKELENE